MNSELETSPAQTLNIAADQGFVNCVVFLAI